MSVSLTPHRTKVEPHGWQTSSPVIMAELRNDMITTLELAPRSTWRQIVDAAIAAHGGTLIPASSDNWGPHWWQVSLLGIEGTGQTLEEATREWCACVRRSAREPQGAA